MPGMVCVRGSAFASGRYWATPCCATQPVMPCADPEAELVGDLVLVLADLAVEGDRLEVLADDGVDAHVVIVDELVELAADGLSDLAHVGQAGEARAELLDRLELCRPGRRPRVVARVGNGDAGLRSEGIERVEVRLAPRPRTVLIEGEDAQDLVAGHERGHSHRVEALLDHRGTDAGATGIVGVVARRERMTLLEHRRCERRGREGAHELEVALGEAVRCGGGEGAVGLAQVDRGAIGPEEQRGMLDQVGHDQRQVQLGGDVGADAAERLGLLQLPLDATHEAHAVGRHRHLVRDRLEQLGIMLPERPGPIVGDQQHAPRLVADEDGHGDLAAHVRQVGDVARIPAHVGHDDRPPLEEAGPREPLVAPDGRVARHVHAGRDAQPEQVVAQLRDRGHAIAEGLAQDARDRGQRGIEIGHARRLARDRGQDLQLHVAPLGGRVPVPARDPEVRLTRGAGPLRDPRRPVARTRTGPRPRPPRDRRPARLRPTRRGLEERIEVLHAVAPVAARVDAQAAQPTLVGPGADRVGMDAQDARGLGHGDSTGAGWSGERGGLLVWQELVSAGEA